MNYDGIKLCEKCGEYTTGRLCTACAWQEMIDNAPEPDGELGVQFEEPSIDEDATKKVIIIEDTP